MTAPHRGSGWPWFFAAGFVIAGCGGGESVVDLSDDPAFPSEPFWNAVPKGGAAVVTNAYSDTLSVVSLSPGELEKGAPLGEIPIGLVPVEREGPHHVATSPDGSRIYVGISNFVPGSGGGPHGSHGTGSADGYVLMFDSETMTLIESQRIDRSPGDLTTTADGSLLLVSHYDFLKITEAGPDATEEDTYSTVAILDAETLEPLGFIPVCAAPHGLRFSSEGDQLYVACSGGDQIAIVDTETFDTETFDTETFDVVRVPVADGVVPPPNGTATFIPNSVHVSPLDGRVWVALIGELEMRVFDPTTGTMDECVLPMGAPPYFGMFIDDGATMLVPVQGVTTTDLVWIDAASCTETARISLPAEDCQKGHMVVKDRDGDDGRGYLVCEGDRTNPGTFVVLSSVQPDAAVEAVIPVGVFPDGAAMIYPGLGINPP